MNPSLGLPGRGSVRCRTIDVLFTRKTPGAIRLTAGSNVDAKA